MASTPASNLDAASSDERLAKMTTALLHGVTPAWTVKRRDRCPHVTPCASAAACFAALYAQLDAITSADEDPVKPYLRLVDQMRHKTVPR